MATREKKLSAARKQIAPSPSLKEHVEISTITQENDTNEALVVIAETKQNPTEPPKKRITKSKIRYTQSKPFRKFGLPQQKMRNKANKNLLKTILKNTDKKKLLTKQVQPKTRTVLKNKKAEDKKEPDVEVIPEVVEDEEIVANKSKKKPKRVLKKDEKKANNETERDQPKPKRAYKRKLQNTPEETLDDLMNDLTSLIKQEPVSPEEETPKVPKKIVKKKKINIGKLSLAKLSPQQRKVIDMLDLNVNKLGGLPAVKRRHSIEKIPIGNLENPAVFNRSPRVVPKTKTLMNRPQNPYKTRSDSPARILRNGKHTKLRDMALLEGLGATRKRRRRNHSDLSEGVSKCEYESDSSFSDMSSLHSGVEPIENRGEVVEIVKTEKENDGSAENVMKRSLSALEGEANGLENLTDTNSNLCLNNINDKENVGVNVKQEVADTENIAVSPSVKVPEKSIILDIMKQTFNEKHEENGTTCEDPPLCEEPPKPAQEPTKQETTPEEPLQNGDSEVPVENGTKDVKVEEESPEDLAVKEHILQALGLQSMKAATEAKMRTKEKSDKTDYTGTLKTVIKLNRGDKKKGKCMKMAGNKGKKDCDVNGIEDTMKAIKDVPSTSWKQSGQSSDTAGAQRKTHYSNRSNPDGSSEISDGEPASQEGGKSLVIPEKASSFSIHPGRLCKDECSYCYGKFGLFDTPCHIAQMKTVERQNKILATEKHLTRDSCLCDACYRHVDRKANTPSYTNKSYKRSPMVAPGPRQDHCHVLGCNRVAANILRRKWIIKMKKSICDVINIDLDNPGLHSIPICDEHFAALEHLMICAMCKRRLAKNHIHYLGNEVVDLNAALKTDGIPLTLSDKPVVCKLCKYFAAIILKPESERPENSTTFFVAYRKRLLHFNDIEPMDEASAEEPIIIPTKERNEPGKKQRNSKKNGKEVEKIAEANNKSRSQSPTDYMVDYNTLIPSIAMECESDSDTNKKLPQSLKQAVEISKNNRLKSSEIAVQRLGANPSISVRQLFPCEEDLPLQGCIEFGNVKERTPEGWEKCTSVIQYDMETKNLWQELQKPYGNQSSFLRHLILLEKYFRNGDLILANNASHHSINYSESVHNRLRAFDNIPTNAGNVQPFSMIPFNKQQKSNSGIITSASPQELNAANIPKSTPITLTQINSAVKPKASTPPGLISLLPGTNKPISPITKSQKQAQKIKFPITKNWRPTLIPIDPNNKNSERKAGLVQVISGGKPYHITLEDYKKMCAIKKSFELKQKRLQEANKSKPMRKSLNKTIEVESCESILEKLDRHVEKIGEKPPITLPKIPKSLTVIPQTVTRRPLSRPASPELLITPAPKQLNKSS